MIIMFKITLSVLFILISLPSAADINVSHAIAMHMACDYGKGLKRHLKDNLMVSSLGSNNALSSAIANDFGYEQVFSRYIEAWGKPGDILLGISTSGTSPNILKAAEEALKRQQEMGVTANEHW